MLGLVPAAQRLIEVVTVVLILPWLTIMIAALLMRQLRWFGMGGRYDG
jgi:hypothetical protein